MTAAAAGPPPMASSSNALPYLQRIQRMDTSLMHRFSHLDMAETELNTYCSRLDEHSTPAPER